MQKIILGRIARDFGLIARSKHVRVNTVILQAIFSWLVRIEGRYARGVRFKALGALDMKRNGFGRGRK